jgi:hypothetical protein
MGDPQLLIFLQEFTRASGMLAFNEPRTSVSGFLTMRNQWPDE